jgi:succinyl-CoA synthetase beta subunit
MLTKNMGDANKVPIIVRLQGTNAAIAKELIDNSGMPLLSAESSAAGPSKSGSFLIKNY